jgi:hypothetical protein
MPEVRFMSEGDKEILLIDISHVSDYKSIPLVVSNATDLAQSRSGPGSLRTLLDLTGTPVNKLVVASLKSLSGKNGRYAKATAFVGLNGIWTMLLRTMFWMRAKRNHKIFPSRSDAIAWLQTWE